MKNLIILGPGRTGSSVLAGIIAKNRYYINEEEIQSRESYPDGDYENPELVDLNKKLFSLSGYGWNKVLSFKEVNISFMDSYAQSENKNEFLEFVKKCESNSPWLWKDPRLIFTIYFWRHFINIKEQKVIVITRDPNLVFRSHSKRQIKATKKEIFQRYHYQMRTLEHFLKNEKIFPLRIDYSELWEGEKLIEKINDFMDIKIAMADYNSIVRKDIKRKKETKIQFARRYYFGLLKLFVQRSMKRRLGMKSYSRDTV